MGPMTVIVVVVLVAILLVGVGIIFQALTQGSRRGRERMCDQCHSKNPGHARFCSHCGHAFESS